MTVKISRSEIARSSGYTVENSRSPNTGFTPLLGALPFPASLLDDLAAEDDDLGYTVDYQAKSAALRNKMHDCWVSDNGFSVGDLHAFHGVPLVDIELESWISNASFVKRKVSAMRFPRLDSFPGIEWTTNFRMTPGQDQYDLKATNREFVKRVCIQLFGRDLPDSMIDYATFRGNTSATTNWNGTNINANMGTFTAPERGPAGTITVMFVQSWAKLAFTFRFSGFGVQPQTTFLAFEFNIWNWRGDQAIYGDLPTVKSRTVAGYLTMNWTAVIRRSTRAFLGRNNRVKTGLGNVYGNIKFENPYATEFGWNEVNWGDMGGILQVYQDEVMSDGVFTNYGGIRHGRFYVAGVQPFFRGVHVQGATTFDSVARTISVDQEIWAMDWLGSDLLLMLDNPTPEQQAKLNQLRVMSSLNLAGNWVTPANPLHNLSMWADAVEAEIDLSSEVFAEATADNPQITFGQANTRASLKTLNMLHRMDPDAAAEPIARVVITGSLVGNLQATSYQFSGAASTAQDRDLMLHALKDGATLQFQQTTVTNEDAFYTLFDTPLSSLELSLGSVGGGGHSELDESVMFQSTLPQLSTGIDLKTRSAFSLVSLSPSRKNMNDIASSGLVMMHQLRKRFIP